MDSEPTPGIDGPFPVPETVAMPDATRGGALESFWWGCVGCLVIPLLTGGWFFLGLGFQTLLEVHADTTFAFCVGGGVAVLALAFAAARGRAFLRGVAVGGWAALLQVAALVAWTSDSQLLHGSASGGNGGMAAAFQLGYLAVAYVVAGGVGCDGSQYAPPQND